MTLEDRIFFSYKEAVETFIRIGFDFTEEKGLILNNLEVQILKIGNEIWRTKVISNGYQYQTNT